MEASAAGNDLQSSRLIDEEWLKQGCGKTSLRRESASEKGSGLKGVGCYIRDWKKRFSCVLRTTLEQVVAYEEFYVTCSQQLSCLDARGLKLAHLHHMYIIYMTDSGTFTACRRRGCQGPEVWRTGLWHKTTATGCSLHLRSKGVCKRDLKSLDMDVGRWEEIASGRHRWRQEVARVFTEEKSNKDWLMNTIKGTRTKYRQMTRPGDTDYRHREASTSGIYRHREASTPGIYRHRKASTPGIYRHREASTLGWDCTATAGSHPSSASWKILHLNTKTQIPMVSQDQRMPWWWRWRGWWRWHQILHFTLLRTSLHFTHYCVKCKLSTCTVCSDCLPQTETCPWLRDNLLSHTGLSQSYPWLWNNLLGHVHPGIVTT